MSEREELDLASRRHELRSAATDALWRKRSMMPEHSEEIVDDVLDAVVPLIAPRVDWEGNALGWSDGTFTIPGVGVISFSADGDRTVVDSIQFDPAPGFWLTLAEAERQ